MVAHFRRTKDKFAMNAGNVVTVLFDSDQESNWNESDVEESMEDT